MSDKLEINSAYIERLTALIKKNNYQELIKILDELHIADIAEIIEGLSSENAKHVYSLIADEENYDTITSKILIKPETDSSFILIDTENQDDTSLLQAYPLPYGWPVDSASTKNLLSTKKTNKKESKKGSKTKTQKSDAIDDQIIKQLADSNMIYIAALTFTSPDNKTIVHGLSLESKQNTISIGRNKECSVSLDTPSVSEHHADLISDQGKWILKDTNSTNGIVMNGKHHKKVTLKDGYLLSLGQVELAFREIKWVI